MLLSVLERSINPLSCKHEAVAAFTSILVRELNLIHITFNLDVISFIFILVVFVEDV